MTFTRHDGTAAAGIFDSVIIPVYEASHADVIANPFYSTGRFAERVRGYMRAPGFELVAVYAEGCPIGQAFGYALQPGARWWDGLATAVPDGFTDETGRRTFALNELMVEPQWQRRGIAHALHDELLRGRPEERATLLVRADNDPAQTAYARWGWRKVAKLRPYPDSPLFDALTLPLPVPSPGASSSRALEFRRYGAEAARAARDMVEEIYQDAYAEFIASGEPFDSVEAFMGRFDSYTRGGHGFDMVIAFAEGEPAGQALGWPLAPGSGWWGGIDREPEPGFTEEDGARTFAFSEIMVRREWTGRGIAHALHDELLRGRDEQRATLLVEPDNETAYRAYLRWGWRKVAQLRPDWPGAPLFDVLILPLPVRSAGGGNAG